MISAEELQRRRLPLKGIQFAGHMQLGRHDLGHIRGLPYFRDLKLSDSAVSSEQIEQLGTNPLLGNLKLDGINLTTSQMQCLESFSNLTILQIDASQVDDDGRRFNDIPSLRELRIVGQSRCSLSKLKNPNLSILRLSRTPIEDPTEILAIQERNPDLTIAAEDYSSLGMNRMRDASIRLIESGADVDVRQFSFGKVAGFDPSNWSNTVVYRVYGIRLPDGYELNGDFCRDMVAVPSVFQELHFTNARNTELLRGRFGKHFVGQFNLSGSDLDDRTFVNLSETTLIDEMDVRGTSVSRDAILAFQDSQPTTAIQSDHGRFPAQHRLPKQNQPVRIPD